MGEQLPKGIVVKRLLASLADLLEDEYRDNGSLVGTAEDELEQSLATFPNNPGVLNLLTKPLFPDVTAVKSSYLGALRNR